MVLLCLCTFQKSQMKWEHLWTCFWEVNMSPNLGFTIMHGHAILKTEDTKVYIWFKNLSTVFHLRWLCSVFASDLTTDGLQSAWPAAWRRKHCSASQCLHLSLLRVNTACSSEEKQGSEVLRNMKTHPSLFQYQQLAVEVAVNLHHYFLSV